MNALPAATERSAAALDEELLARWMKANVVGFAGPLTTHRFEGGQSNPTYRIDTPQRSYVLRRKPPGMLVKGAHAIDREARVMLALQEAGFPVPRVLAVCLDDSVIGSWFFVMNLIEGRIFWDARFSEIPAADRGGYLDAMNATLASLHRIDPASVGLEDHGRSGGYIPRQLERWSRQYMEDTAAGRHEAMDRLVEWLARHVPAEDETAIIHGDFRADNMIFHPTQPRVIAVLDWELSTLGHPLADFAYHAMMYRMPTDIPGGIAGVDPVAWGLPDETAYVAAYCRRTGRAGIPALDYYVAFNMFRFAAILHGIRGRVARNTAASRQAASMAGNFERVAELGWQQAQRASW